MPLSDFQKGILRILSRSRSPESHFAGGSPIAARSKRLTDDYDIFHDRPAGVAEAATTDAEDLEKHGHPIRWLRQLPGIWTAELTTAPTPFRIEWAHDSAFRFFPARRDESFGYVLHPADLMTNKVMTAGGRRKPRDLVDIVDLSKDVPIEAAILAACGKDPGMTPGVILENVMRFSRYQQHDFDMLKSIERIDGAAIVKTVRDALERTEKILEKMPTEMLGTLFFENGRIVTPDPNRIKEYGTRKAAPSGIAPALERAPVSEIGKRYIERGR